MKNLLFLTLSFIFLSLSNLVLGQAMKINGAIYDSTGSKPVNNATITAVRIKDSLLLSYTHSNLQGQFELKGFEIDTFTLYIEHPSFETKTIYIFGNAENALLNVNSIKLGTKVQEFDEIMIYANKNPIYYRGDTLVYVADSFKVGENAVVEDLLKKLPGIKIDKDGKITSQGREISQVLVDGDEFFGSDPTIATKNLAAKGVESVEIYEKKNEDAALGDDEKIQVLDLKLKDAAKRGYFGKVSGASDFGLIGENGFYEGELLFNKFDKKRKISVFVLSSNTPRSNFGWGDMNKFGLENERESSGMSMWDQSAQKLTGGVPQTLKAGIYYSDRFGKTGKVGFNYSFYNNKLSAIENSLSQYFLADSSYYTRDSSNNISTNQSHKINFNISSNLDSLTSFEIKPSVSFDIANTDNTSSAKFLSEDFAPTFETIIQNVNESKGINFRNEMTINRKFRLPRRMLEFKYVTQLTDNKTDGKLITQSIFNQSINSVDQKKINDNSSISHYSFLTYTEPFNKNWKGQVEYLFEYGTSKQDKQTFNRGLDSSYTENVSFLSNEFDNKRLQHRGTALLIYETNIQTIIGGLGFRSISINNNNLVSDTSINQQIYNFLPRFSYQFKPSMSKRLGIFYTTNSSQPSISDLQPVQDNSNPNRIKVGNPDLKPNYVHNLRINFNSWQAMTGKYIWSGANATLTNNAFANSTDFDSIGRQTSKTENVDGNLFANIFAGVGFPILNRKIEFSPNVNASYTKYSNFINSQQNITKNTALSGGLSIEFQLDSLEIEISQSYSYNNPVSSLSASSNLPYSAQNYGIDFKWTLPAHVIIEFDAEYSINSQRANGYNKNLFILNAEIKKEFGARQNTILSLQANDILNQNLTVQRQLNGNIITDNFTKIISRYFLMKLTYKFNNNKTKEDDFTGWH
jgi:hypothetical protein